MQGPKLGTLLLSRKVPCTHLELCKCMFNEGINTGKVRLYSIAKSVFVFQEVQYCGQHTFSDDLVS